MTDAIVAIRNAVKPHLARLEAGDVVLVAVSGGADSLALAHALSLEAPKLALRVEGVTVDHQLQSQSSVQAEKVAAALSKMGIEKTHVIKVDIDITDGLEASARRARYGALDACAEKTGAVFIFLGHTRDDQSESVLSKAYELGIKSKIHVNQFNSFGGIKLALKYNALSVNAI